MSLTQISDYNYTSLLKQATVNIGDTTIRALPTTDVTLVPAPGQSQVIVPQFGVLLTSWTGLYSGVDADAYIEFLVGGTNVLDYLPNDVGVSILNNFFGIGGSAPASRLWYVKPIQKLSDSDLFSWDSSPYSVTTDPPSLYNGSMTLAMSNGSNLTGGDSRNTLRITIAYLILDVTSGLFT